MADDDINDVEDLLLDTEFSDKFYTVLDTEGIAASITEDGLLIAFSKTKIDEMVSIAAANEDGNVVIYIKRYHQLQSTKLSN